MKNLMKKRSKFMALILSVIMILSSATVAWAADGEAVANPENDYEYEVLSDGTLTLTKFIGTYEKEMIIPDTIDGKAVTELKDYNVYDDSMADIIEKLVINKNLRKLVGVLSFPYIKSYTVDPDNGFFSSVDGVLFNKIKDMLIAFPRVSEKTSYTVPDGVEIIGDSAFLSWPGYGLKNITLPNTLTTIQDYAFFGNRLENIDLPDSLITIGEYAFASTRGFKSIVIPPNVNEIGNYAFSISSIRELIFMGYNIDIDGSEFEYISEGVTSPYPDGMVLSGFKGSIIEETAKEFTRWGITFKEITDATLASEKSDTSIEATVEALVEAGTTLSFYEVISGLDEEGFNNLVKDAESHILYNITLKNGDREVQPITGKAKVRFKAPNGYTANSTKLYRIDNGTGNDSVYTEMAISVDDNGFVSFETEHFSSYVLLNMGGGTTEPTTQPNTEPTTGSTENTTGDTTAVGTEKNNDIPQTGDASSAPIAIFAAISALSCAVVLVLMKKKKIC